MQWGPLILEFQNPKIVHNNGHNDSHLKKLVEKVTTIEV